MHKEIDWLGRVSLELDNGDFCLCAERLEGVDAHNGWREYWTACMAVDIDQGLAIPIRDLVNGNFDEYEGMCFKWFLPLTRSNLAMAARDNKANEEKYKQIYETTCKQTR